MIAVISAKKVCSVFYFSKTGRQDSEAEPTIIAGEGLSWVDSAEPSKNSTAKTAMKMTAVDTLSLQCK